jgi:uncharacterized protein YggL (DUF469 family)
MKNKYEYLANEFQEKLGDKFNLVYNNDESIEWDKILIDDMISGVMHVNSGAYDKVNGYAVSTQQIGIQFMIPTIPEIFSVAIQQIEDTFKAFHNQLYEFNNEVIKVLFNYISDANRTLVNGTDYATVYIYLNLFSVESALMASETIVSIDGQQLKGVFHVTYSNNHTSDSIVKGNVSLVQINNVNAIQQILNIDLVVIKDDNLIIDLMFNSTDNKLYDISYNNGLITRTFKGYVVNLIEDGVFNDTLKVKVAFGVANE